ncbi:MAG: family 10 glycosylhydrolase [Bacteroidaceae bacterium]|nr:family 10 glycosylhydrolase [Bacteroidaceae bacterium]
MRRVLSTLLLAVLTTTLTFATAPKREFRGAWIQAVNHQFEGIPAAELKAELSRQLDSLASCGINAILFQVRVEADALYKSDLEPWSAFLTGIQGLAPDEDWDPLQFMIEECHNRCMELHAWINPFRAKTAPTNDFAYNHQMRQHPERIIRYGELALFDPALKENRDWICQVAADIIRRYDIDGFHIDDYFYPYPDGNLKFNDDASFKQNPRGFTNRDDWRRDNVNLFIEQLYHTVKDIKPWVKFGISPFGIYRNKSASYPDGSESSGFENWSGLYADVLLWIEKGWVDYCIPQVYWNTGNKAADYSILTQWWSDHAGGCLMYIGQDVERTVQGKDPNHPESHQLRHKMNLQRILRGLQGSCQWPAKSVVDNPKGYRTILKAEFYSTPALQPLSGNMPSNTPGKVRKLMPVETKDGTVLFWTAPKARRELDKAIQYVVYRFEKGEPINLDEPHHIAGITRHSFLNLPYRDGTTQYTYVVTALNRIQRESAPVKCKVSL